MESLRSGRLKGYRKPGPKYHSPMGAGRPSRRGGLPTPQEKWIPCLAKRTLAGNP